MRIHRNGGTVYEPLQATELKGFRLAAQIFIGRELGYHKSMLSSSLTEETERKQESKTNKQNNNNKTTTERNEGGREVGKKRMKRRKRIKDVEKKK